MKNFFLIRLLEVGRFQIFEVGRSTLLWSTPSVSVYKDLEQGNIFFVCLLLPLLAISLLHWLLSLLLWDSGVQWRPEKTSSLMNSTTTGFLDLPLIVNHCWINWTTNYKSFQYIPFLHLYIFSFIEVSYARETWQL